MGIKGLLPSLQSITRQVDLEKYRGLTVAVDAMCWLHKGIFTGNVSALAKYQFRNLVERNDDAVHVDHPSTRRDNGSMLGLASTVKRLDFDKVASRRNRFDSSKNQIPNVEAMEAMSKCIDYVIRHAVQLQKQYGLDIILVIDGDSLPIKHTVNEKRRHDREEAYQQGLAAEKKGDNRQARKFYSKACSITYEMRRELILQCKRYQIQFIVAPYEADAQMAKLAHSGNVDVIITEDSDLLAYGCPRVLFKIDFKVGRGEEIQLMRDLAMNDPLSFRHWNHDMFVYMCILAGCDYCEGIPGIGLQKAHKLVRIYRKPKKILNALQDDGKMPDGFEDSFWSAYRTFRHQRVYCSKKREIDHLFEVREVLELKSTEWNYLGSWIEPNIAIGIAEGVLHPKAKIPWETACSAESNNLTFNDRSRTRRNVKKQSETPQRKRLPIDRSPIEKSKINEVEPADKNLFAFFKSKRRKEPKRPPLQVITIDENASNVQRNKHSTRRKSQFNSIMVQSVPSNYHDYSTHLVSSCFKPISQQNIVRTNDTRRSSVNKALRDLRQKLSLQRLKKKDHLERRIIDTANQANCESNVLIPKQQTTIKNPNQENLDDELDYRRCDSHEELDFEDLAHIALPIELNESCNEQYSTSNPVIQDPHESNFAQSNDSIFAENDFNFDEGRVMRNVPLNSQLEPDTCGGDFYDIAASRRYDNNCTFRSESTDFEESYYQSSYEKTDFDARDHCRNSVRNYESFEQIYDNNYSHENTNFNDIPKERVMSSTDEYPGFSVVGTDDRHEHTRDLNDQLEYFSSL